MAFCTNCGSQIVEGNSFCVSCGTRADAQTQQPAPPAPTYQPEIPVQPIYQQPQTPPQPIYQQQTDPQPAYQQQQQPPQQAPAPQPIYQQPQPPQQQYYQQQPPQQPQQQQYPQQMQYPQKKKSGAVMAIVIPLVVLLVVGGVIAAFYLPGGSDSIGRITGPSGTYEYGIELFGSNTGVGMSLTFSGGRVTVRGDFADLGFSAGSYKMNGDDIIITVSDGFEVRAKYNRSKDTVTLMGMVFEKKK